MKYYFNLIQYAAILLLLFPFLGFSETWETLYVIILAIVIGFSNLYIRKNVEGIKRKSEDKSLQGYIDELKTRFKNFESQTPRENIHERSFYKKKDIIIKETQEEENSSSEENS